MERIESTNVHTTTTPLPSFQTKELTLASTTHSHQDKLCFALIYIYIYIATESSTMLVFAAAGESMYDGSHDTNNYLSNCSNNFSAIVFAVVTLIIYVLFLRPTTADRNARQAAAAAAAGAVAGGGGTRAADTATRPRGNHHENRTTAPAAARRQPPTPIRGTPLSDSALEVLSKCQSKPPHVKQTLKATDMKIGGSNVLVDGLVGLSSTQAAAAGTENVERKRSHLKERAKILNQFLKTATGSAATAPPAKGTNMVIGISQTQLSGDEGAVFARVVSNLATHYTLLVIVQVDNHQSQQDFVSAQKLQEQLVRQLREHACLRHESTLPSHRVLLSNAATGRVALVRQVSTVGLVVDFDADVQRQLGQFGYKVAVVPEWCPSFSWILSPSS
jgi:hypothetical protein